MKLVMISVVQNSAVDAFTSSTETVVTDAEVRDKHKLSLELFNMIYCCDDKKCVSIAILPYCSM